MTPRAAFLAAFAALAVPAEGGGQSHGAAPAGGGRDSAAAGAGYAAGPETRRLGTEIARLRREIAGLERLAVWQRELLRAAKSDPAAAMAQRRPMADCLASALAPVCGRLPAMFAGPDPDLRLGAGAAAGEGPR